MSWLLLLKDGNGAICIHRDETGSLELLDHLVSIGVVPLEVLYLGNLGLELVDSGELCLDSGLVGSFLHFGREYLLLRASPHVTLLQHVDAAAFCHYNKDELEILRYCTYKILPLKSRKRRPLLDPW